MKLNTKIASVTHPTDTNIYASGDQVGIAKEITNAVESTGGRCTLESLAIVDKAKQKSALTILFFNAQPTVVSSDNGAMDVSDAEMAAKFIGLVKVPAADYVDLANSSFFGLNNIDLLLHAAAGYTSLWYMVLSGGTPTYTSVTDLILKFGLIQH